MLTLPQIFDLSDHNQDLGYLYELALDKAKHLPDSTPFVEVGTRSGGTTLLFLHAIANSGKPRLMFSIDPYGFKPFMQGNRTLYDLYGEHYWKIAAKHIANMCADSNLIYYSHWKITSLDFIKIYDQIEIWHNGEVFRDKFGFVYLDGDHCESTISQELAWFSPRLHQFGSIIVDDSEHILYSNDKTIQAYINNSFQRENRIFFPKIS